MKMRTSIITERRLSVHAKRYLLTAWFFCVATGLHAETFVFKSGATVQGQFVEFTGTNSATIKRSADGKSYTITVSDLTPASQARLRSPRAPARTAAPAKPWSNDPGWLSCQKAVEGLRTRREPIARQADATLQMAKAKSRAGKTPEMETKEYSQWIDLNAALGAIDREIGKCRAKQAQIEAAFAMRDAFKKP